MPPTSAHRILGIDPGSLNTGLGIVEARGNRLTFVHCGVVRTHAKQTFPERLKTIHEGVTAAMEQFQPTAMAMEDIFFATNARSTIKLGQARGVILLAGAQAGLPIHEYSPLEVKQTLVGHGRADKKQVQSMVMHLLSLKTQPESLDASDALAVAICHLNLFSTREKFRKAGA